MVRITEELIKRKAEHHDGLITDLEELTLHQLEIEKIEVLGTVCRKLKILYLQNNVIPKIENIYHLKELRYLNLALNNITKIEGLASCEFLTKLDLTVNFIDLDELESSMEHLSSVLHLNELYLMGNPCTEWTPHRQYVICMLPGLRHLDGKDVTRTERITAMQRFKALRLELHDLANKKRDEKGVPRVSPRSYDGDDEENEPWCPETRVKMAREAAAQREEQEARRREMEPVKRNYAKEQEEAVSRVRSREAADAGPDGKGRVKQCNEGRWEFNLEDEDGYGNIILRLSLPRFLDTSLIDVDVHPSYVSVVIRGKTFRILWPEEVRSSDGSCKRSQTTGEMVITVPKVSPSEAFMSLRRREKGLPVGGGGGGGQGAPAIRASEWGRQEGKSKVDSSTTTSKVDAVLTGKQKSTTSTSTGGGGGGKRRFLDELFAAAKIGEGGVDDIFTTGIQEVKKSEDPQPRVKTEPKEVRDVPILDDDEVPPLE